MAGNVDLQQSSLDLMILKAVSFGPVHGYAIVRWIQAATEDMLRLEEGTLYPALHRLEERGWIGSDWGTSENNRRARFYELTGKGRRQLREAASTWSNLARAVEQVLDASKEPV
jgi:PadR family transcriptional regulator PadR